MITNKQNWIEQMMIKVDCNLVEIYERDYGVSEYEARRMLAEMYYGETFHVKTKTKEEEVIGYLQY